MVTFDGKPANHELISHIFSNNFALQILQQEKMNIHNKIIGSVGFGFLSVEFGRN